MQQPCLRGVISAAAIIATLAVGGSAAAAGFEDFQARVNAAAAKAGVEAPDVKSLLAPGTSSSSSAVQSAAAGASRRTFTAPVQGSKRIERVLTIPSENVTAVKPSGAPMVFLLSGGRYALMGTLVDVWERRKVGSIEELEASLNRMNLAKLGFEADKLNLIRVGKGKRVVTVFLDPRCGWCHKLLEEIEADGKFFDDYRLDIIVTAVLGDVSARLAKTIACADADDAAKYKAFREGARAVEALKQKSVCTNDAYDLTMLTLGTLGINASPFIVAPDGRISRGKPVNLRAFLEPGEATEKRTVDAALQAADSLKKAAAAPTAASNQKRATEPAANPATGSGKSPNPASSSAASQTPNKVPTGVAEAANAADGAPATAADNNKNRKP